MSDYEILIIDDIIKEIYGKTISKNDVESYLADIQRLKLNDYFDIEYNYPFNFYEKQAQELDEIYIKRLEARLKILFKLLGALEELNLNECKIDSKLITSLKIKNLFNAEDVIKEVYELIKIIKRLFENRYNGFFLSDYAYSILSKDWITNILKSKKDIEKNIKVIIESFQITDKEKQKEPEKEDILPKLESIIELIKENYTLKTTEQRFLFDNVLAEKDNLYSDEIQHINKFVQKLPDYLCKTKDILSNKITDRKNPIPYNEHFKLDVGGGVETIFLLSYDDKKVTLDEKITAYEKAILDIVTTLYISRNKVITDRMIYKVLHGTDGAKKESLEKINRIMNKLRNIIVYIDRTEEVKLYNKNIDKNTDRKYTINAPLIMYEGCEVKAGKETINAYRTVDTPILFKYAEPKGHLIRIENKYLEIPINKNEETITITHYLIKEIEWMKNNKAKQERNQWITYESVYNELGLDPAEITKEKAFKIRGHIETILKHWVEGNYISSFEQYKENGKFIGITINI